VQHEEFDRSARSAEVRSKASQIPPENLTPLHAQMTRHLRSESWLRAQKLQIVSVQQTEHGPVTLDRKLVDPFRGNGETPSRQGNPVQNRKNGYRANDANYHAEN
jgi:hypothetical protein